MIADLWNMVGPYSPTLALIAAIWIFVPDDTEETKQQMKVDGDRIWH